MLYFPLVFRCVKCHKYFGYIFGKEYGLYVKFIHFREYSPEQNKRTHASVGRHNAAACPRRSEGNAPLVYSGGLGNNLGKLGWILLIPLFSLRAANLRVQYEVLQDASLPKILNLSDFVCEERI